MAALESPSLVLLTFALGGVMVLALLIGRVLRARRRAKRRVVEKPNSHYAAPAVREEQTRHRWREIALERIHEINREEVVRLMERAEASGVQALSASERTFLDHMVEIAGVRAAPTPREKVRPVAQELRESPA